MQTQTWPGTRTVTSVELQETGPLVGVNPRPATLLMLAGCRAPDPPDEVDHGCPGGLVGHTHPTGRFRTWEAAPHGNPAISRR